MLSNSHQEHRSCEVELVDTCDLCGGRTFDKEGSVNGWNLNKCSECGLVFTSPRYTELYLQKMYKESYYDVACDYLQVQLSEPSQDLIDLARSLMRRRGGSGKTKWARSLDVGCGAGLVVSAFQKAGWEAIGIDLSMKAISAGKDRGLDLREVSIEDQTLGKFNLVSAFHILEHIHSPKQFLRRCTERLGQGGYLLIEVPDYKCQRALRMGKSWPYLYPSTHLYQFTAETLTNYLDRAKFGIIKIRKVYGKGPLEHSTSQAGYKSQWRSKFKNSLFKMRHLLYWSPLTRQLLRYLYWHALGYGECIRILAQKGC